jgi:ribosomal protein S27AE
MNAKDKIYNERTFDDEKLTCPKCGWNGTGDQAHVAGFYGIGKFKEALCPHCSEYLGNILREQFNGENDRLDSQTGPV